MRLFCHRLVLLGFVLLVAVLRAQEPPAPDSAHIVIHSNVQEVVLDVVVRHKDQSLATNLKASDFTVTESGVPQTIRSFRLAGGREAGVIAPPSPPAGAPPRAGFFFWREAERLGSSPPLPPWRAPRPAPLLPRRSPPGS